MRGERLWKTIGENLFPRLEQLSSPPSFQECMLDQVGGRRWGMGVAGLVAFEMLEVGETSAPKVPLTRLIGLKNFNENRHLTAWGRILKTAARGGSDNDSSETHKCCHSAARASNLSCHNRFKAPSDQPLPPLCIGCVVRYCNASALVCICTGFTNPTSSMQ